MNEARSTHAESTATERTEAAEQSGAAAEYARRRTERLAEAALRARRFRNVGVVRLAAAAAFIALVWLVFKGLPGWWLAVPAAAFVVCVVVQDRITRARRRCERAAAFYERGLERLADRWAGHGRTGARFLEDSHPYAADLDLFGRGSLFELLSTARTRAGEETLARWLLAPAAPDAVRARQRAVAELRPMLDLREDLALLGEGVRTGEEAHSLSAWAARPPWKVPTLTRVLTVALALLSLAGLALWFAGAGPIPFLVAFALGRVFERGQRRHAERALGGVDGAGRDLALLAGVLARLERERFNSPRLAELRAALDAEGRAPSRQIARLNLLIDLYDARRNPLFAPLALLLLWPLQMAFAVERWRAACGPAGARWLDAVGEFEALSSLAGYSYERPEDPFAEIAEGGAALFEAEDLGHPLIPSARNVRTSLRLSDEPRVLVVSGSNMSGKSTLLRTVGVNAVLALAGAPVRARSLRLSPLQVGASIRVQDSLQAGASRFYAEIKRLRQIVALTDSDLPVLFLLDEILHGTNSHDRRIGGEGVVRGLITRGAVGLVTTHDLALARIADELAPRAANVHFEDQMEGGRMSFDYLLRPGVVQRSNALELMRSVGLEV